MKIISASRREDIPATKKPSSPPCPFKKGDTFYSVYASEEDGDEKQLITLYTLKVTSIRKGIVFLKSVDGIVQETFPLSDKAQYLARSKSEAYRQSIKKTQERKKAFERRIPECKNDAEYQAAYKKLFKTLASLYTKCKNKKDKKQTPTIRFGKTQKDILCLLVRWRKWKADNMSGWTWGNNSRTTKLLDDLVTKSFAQVSPDGTYTPTPQGLAWVKEHLPKDYEIGTTPRLFDKEPTV